MTCPCGKGETFETCCGPFLQGRAKPKTAEELMRSRYTAFTRGDVDYVMKTHDPDTVHQVDRRSTEEWAEQSEWLGFELLDSRAGGPEDFQGTIEFVARYRIKGVNLEHRELATFRRQDDVWYFVDGEQVDLGQFHAAAPAPAAIADPHAGVERLPVEIHACERGRQLQINLGMTVVEAAPERHEPSDRKSGVRADRYGRAPRGAACAFARGGDAFQGVADLAVIVGALPGEGDAPVAAFEQQNAEVFLERLDLPADGAGRDAELLGGLKKAQMSAGTFESANRIKRRETL